MEELRQETVKDTVLLTGEETYLIRWAKDMLKKRYLAPGMEAMDMSLFDEENGSAEDIIRSCETFSMFSARRLVLVRNIPPLLQAGQAKGWGKEAIERLKDYLAHPNERTLLVFMAASVNGKSELVKALKKTASCYSFDPLDMKELRSFAAKRLAARGLKIRSRDMDLLIEETGYFVKESQYRLDQFANDLEKIAAHAENGLVERSDILDAVDGEGETFIFDLLDGISGNDKKKAFEMIQNLLSRDPNSVQSLLGSIISQMELLYMVREFMDSDPRGMSARGIHDRTGIHEYRVKKAMGYARRYSLDRMRSILLSAYDASFQIISGVLEPRLALELFVAQI